MTPAAEPVVARLRAAGCVFAEDEAAVLLEAAADGTPSSRRCSRRREAGEPLEVIVGWAEFRGRRVIVAPGVFVPRRRTELLVVDGRRARAVPASIVVELCCGVAAVASAIAAEVPGAEVYAADIDPAEVAVARRNLPPASRRRSRVFEGDLFDALPAGLRGRVDILIANAPYVPTAEIAHMPPEAREHEPLVALDGGADGLDVQRRITADARDWLAPGGALLIETSVRQAPATAEAMRAGGLEPRIVHDDELDATVVIGRRQRPRLAQHRCDDRQGEAGEGQQGARVVPRAPRPVEGRACRGRGSPPARRLERVVERDVAAARSASCPPIRKVDGAHDEEHTRSTLSPPANAATAAPPSRNGGRNSGSTNAGDLGMAMFISRKAET